MEGTASCGQQHQLRMVSRSKWRVVLPGSGLALGAGVGGGGADAKNFFAGPLLTERNLQQLRSRMVMM